MNDATRLLVMTGLGVAVMVAVTLGLQRWAGLRVGIQPLTAALRAIVQLAALALILQGIFQYPWTAGLMLAVMMTVASLTAGKRLKELSYGRRAAVAGIVTAALTVVTAIFAMRMMELTVSNFIAIGGIITGNSMSAATLSGRRFLASSQAQRGEVEGWFALGARPPQAFAQVRKTAIEEMLLPTIDKTKSTGLVTMPGAFVGALIGGASPVEAARFQLVVLVGIMLAETICGIIVTRVLSGATVIVLDEQPPARPDSGDDPSGSDEASSGSDEASSASDVDSSDPAGAYSGSSASSDSLGHGGAASSSTQRQQHSAGAAEGQEEGCVR
ncbi:ABC transporter permease [Trueperella abortisuis]|uniref:ABC transport system permease protein n=1 Tax=Trueperella abortisuis TaxID=445930 RepID=A0ABT9PKT1_9ACTO|nr:ABC transporter permease [Trueperella abortisuis]MDP9833331.1 putative ABC transport system permease protein [Trueperella abortisuis]